MRVIEAQSSLIRVSSTVKTVHDDVKLPPGTFSGYLVIEDKLKGDKFYVRPGYHYLVCYEKRKIRLKEKYFVW